MLIVAGAGAVYFLNDNTSFSIAQTIDGCEAKTLIPILGRIECEPVSHTPISNEYAQWQKESGWGWSAWHIFEKCGDDENTRECSYYFKDTYGNLGGLYGEVKYRFCTEAWNAASCSSNWNIINIAGKGGYEILLEANKPLGTIIEVWVDGPIYGFDGTRPVLFSRYIPYGLNVYDAGGKFRYSTKWCRLDDLQWDTRQNVCIGGQGQSGSQFMTCKELEDTTRIEFDDWINYVAHWAEGPSELNLVTYTDGNKYYCQPGMGTGGTLWSLGEIRLQSGCYKYPVSTFKSVACCPGMQTANAICKDFVWEPILIGECDAFRPCPTGYECQSNNCVVKAECTSTLQCYGQGEWGVDYSTPSNDIVKYACENGRCVLKERKEVECTPPDVGCAQGYVCSPKDGYKCIKQSGPELVCGDGICTKPYEDEFNCPGDCKVPSFDWMSWLIPALIGLLAGFFAYLKLDKKGMGTRIAGGVIVGIVTAVLLKLVIDAILGVQWWQWLLMGIGGGIFLYLFGGILLVAIAFIINAMKKK